MPLDDDVKSAGRFVGDDDLRVHARARSDCDALFHAAAQLVRVHFADVFTQPDTPEEIVDVIAQVVFGVFDAVVDQAVEDLVLDAHHGVKGVHR